ncbi:MAG TPA: ABC transporter permease subunit [Firmicutes bacterium]|nr:ABC transporter permease subunit [Bacillota bacterium]
MGGHELSVQPDAKLGLHKNWFNKLTSAWASGLGAVTHKELADHLGGKRLLILLGLVAVTGLSAVYVAASTIRESAMEAVETGFVFLLLFSTSGGSLPSFLSFLGFLGPLLGLALGFDSVNGEQTRGTLSRILSQPIHRDSVINGKFLAALCAVSLALVALTLLISGLGIELIGIPPSSEEILRVVCFALLTIVYVAFWLSVSIMFSIVFRQAATSALAGMATWLFFTVFATLLAGLVADAVVPLPSEPTALELMRHQRIEMALSRLSPTTLYYEATSTLLSPHTRALGPISVEQLEGAIPGPLPLSQSLLLIWPDVAGLVAATLLCFAASYVLFMRQEIRAI